MQVVNITNKEQLNNFVDRQKHSQFLQSWEWGEFQKKVTGDILRLGIQENNQLIAVATIIKKLLPIGKSYFYCPRGPVIKLEVIAATAGQESKKLEVNRLLFDKVRDLVKNEGAIFLRFEPLLDIKGQILNFKFSPPWPRPARDEAPLKRGRGRDPDDNKMHKKVAGQISKTIDVQPSRTLILDLAKSEEELLNNMHQKTRYNIRLAEKKGVKIIKGDINQFENFWQLTGETSQRDKFRLHSRNYYHKMLEIDKNFIKLFLAEYDNKIIAANIVSFFGDTATYLHGASSNKYRNVMAPHLLQWHCIKLAKEQGYKYYDFSGIDENKWPGLTRFKKGFGGSVFEYPGTFDLVFDKKWYGIYKLIRRLRRKF
jgi:lipid II:glycine glycyltransferase (peptidoglycan interpeptide bridge formation enzyme)